MLIFIIIYVIVGASFNLLLAKESMRELKEFNILLRPILFAWISITAPIYVLYGMMIGIIRTLKHYKEDGSL